MEDYYNIISSAVWDGQVKVLESRKERDYYGAREITLNFDVLPRR